MGSVTWTYHGERRADSADGFEHRWTTEDPAGDIVVFVVWSEMSGLTEAEAVALCQRRRRENARDLGRELGLTEREIERCLR